MSALRRPRLWITAVSGGLILHGGLWFAQWCGVLFAATCYSCDGTGVIFFDPPALFSAGAESFPCGECSFTARLAAVWDWFRSVESIVVTGVWFLLFLGGAAFLPLKVVRCRRCRGTGRRVRTEKFLRMPRRIIQPECDVCGGRGRATMVDQLVSRA